MKSTAKIESSAEIRRRVQRNCEELAQMDAETELIQIQAAIEVLVRRAELVLGVDKAAHFAKIIRIGLKELSWMALDISIRDYRAKHFPDSEEDVLAVPRKRRRGSCRNFSSKS